MENKQVEQVEAMKAPQLPSRTMPAETIKNLLTSSKSEGPRGALLGGVIGSFVGMGIVGFCFGIGLMGLLGDPRPCRPMPAVKTVNNLEELIRR